MRLSLAAAAMCMVAALPAQAQTVCATGNPDEVLGKLLEHNGQQPLLELQLGAGPELPTLPGILTLDTEGNWSILYVSPSGNLCFLAVGPSAKPATGEARFPAKIMPGESS